MIDKQDPKVKALMASVVIQTFTLIIKICKKDYGNLLTVGDLIELQKEMRNRYRKRGLIE